MIELSNLALKMNNTVILKNITFFVKEKEICGLVGDNGAGKTSTIKCILHEYNKWTGQIIYQGQQLQSSELKHISFFPDTNNAPLHLSVYDYAKYRYLLSRKNYQHFDELYHKLAKSLQLVNFKTRKMARLSGGEKKRSFLLASLITNPDLLILDEPTANLDITAKLEFVELLKILRKIGITTIITSHELSELQSVIDRLVIIDHGKTIYNEAFDNTTESVAEIYQNFKINDELTRIKNNKELMDILRSQIIAEQNHE